MAGLRHWGITSQKVSLADFIDGMSCLGERGVWGHEDSWGGMEWVIVIVANLGLGEFRIPSSDAIEGG